MSIAFITIALGCVFQTLAAQDIRFTATVDRNVVEVGEVVTLTLTVSGNTARIPKPTLPEIKQCKVLSRGSSRNFSFVNGKMQSSVSYTYSLVADEEGTFTIGACEIALKGKVYRTAPIEISVVARREKGDEKVRESVKKEGADDIFIETHVDKEKAFVGEQIVLTFTLYSAVRIMGNPQYIPPATADFWREDLGTEKQYREIINGREYNVNELNYALFPLTAGKKSIGKAQLNVVVEEVFRDPFDFGISSGTRKALSSKPITVQVSSLPDAPDGFSGGVGNFQIEERLEQDTVKQDEPLTVVTTVDGSGNIREVNIPEIDIPGFRIYHSGSSVDIEESEGRLEGRKTFKTVLIPAKSGAFEIPERAFVFFDPEKREYVSKTVNRIPFTVTPTEKKAGSERIFSPLSLEKVGEDIHFIKAGSRFSDDTGMGVLGYLLLLNGLLICVLVSIIVSRQMKARKEANAGLIRKRDALRRALKRIEHAHHEAEKGNVKKAYELLHKAILQFFADKREASIWGMTEQDITELLRASGETEEKIATLRDILSTCNRARYSQEKASLKVFEIEQEKAQQVLRKIRIE